MQTLGVSAALGAAGVVLWGDLSLSSSKVLTALQGARLGGAGPATGMLTHSLPFSGGVLASP